MKAAEQVTIGGTVVPGAMKVFRADPALTLRSSIEEIDAGVKQLEDRRAELHAQAEQIIAETAEIDQTLADAETKRTMHTDALSLIESAAELAPNLPAGELKPAGGDSEVPPAEEPPPASPPVSSNGAGDLPPAEELQDAEPEEPPAPAKRVLIADQILDAMALTAAPGEWLRQRQILDSMPEGTSPNSMRFAIQGLVKDGRIEAKGQRGGRRYRRKETRKPVMQAAERRARPSSEDKPDAPAGERQEPTDEGKVMGALQGQHMDLLQLAERTGIVIPKLRPIVEKLEREGDVEAKQGNPVEYHAVL